MAGDSRMWHADTMAARPADAQNPGDVEMEVCNAIYDAIVSKGFKVIYARVTPICAEWIRCALDGGAFYDSKPRGKMIDMAVFDVDDGALELLKDCEKKIRVGGQVVFRRAVTRRAHVAFPVLNHVEKGANASQWMKYELPLGTGVLILSRVA